MKPYGTLGANFLPSTLDNDEETQEACSLCEAHTVAAEKLPSNLPCPHCGAALPFDNIAIDAAHMAVQRLLPQQVPGYVANLPPSVASALSAANWLAVSAGPTPFSDFGGRHAPVAPTLPSGGYAPPSYGPPSPFPGAMPVMPSGGYGYGPSPSGNYGGGGGGYFDPGDPGNIDWGDGG